MNKYQETVNVFWDIFNRREFEKVKPLLTDNFVCWWPQSKELIRGADNFIAVNQNYPGEWSIKCKRVIVEGNTVVSEVELKFKDQIVFATSFFEFSENKISKLTEYWSEPYNAPEWRNDWVEK